MNIVEAVNKQQIQLIHTLLANKFGDLYADIWKVGVNLGLRIGDLLKLKLDNSVGMCDTVIIHDISPAL